MIFGSSSSKDKDTKTAPPFAKQPVKWAKKRMLDARAIKAWARGDHNAFLAAVRDGFDIHTRFAIGKGHSGSAIDHALDNGSWRQTKTALEAGARFSDARIDPVIAACRDQAILGELLSQEPELLPRCYLAGMDPLLWAVESLRANLNPSHQENQRGNARYSVGRLLTACEEYIDGRLTMPSSFKSLVETVAAPEPSLERFVKLCSASREAAARRVRDIAEEGPDESTDASFELLSASIARLDPKAIPNQTVVPSAQEASAAPQADMPEFAKILLERIAGLEQSVASLRAQLDERMPLPASETERPRRSIALAGKLAFWRAEAALSSTASDDRKPPSPKA